MDSKQRGAEPRGISLHRLPIQEVQAQCWCQAGLKPRRSDERSASCPGGGTLILSTLRLLFWLAMNSAKLTSMYSITRNRRLLSQMTSFSLHTQHGVNASSHKGRQRGQA